MSENNEMHQQLQQKKIKSAVTLMGVQYNFLVIAPVEAMLSYYVYDGSMSSWVYSWLDGTILAGCAIGMLTCGYLGDALGRSNAFVLTLILTVLSTLACGALSWGSQRVVITIVIVTRFFVGMGIGGSIPLSGVETVEEAGPYAAAQSFFCMAIGQVIPYALGYLFSFIPPESWSYLFSGTTNAISIQAQIHGLLLLGMVPALSQLRQAMRHDDVEAKKRVGRSLDVLLTLKANLCQVLTLIGLSFCTLSYDLTAYYIGLFSDTILDTVFTEDTFRATMLQNTIASLICIPTGLLSLYLLKIELVSTRASVLIGFGLLGGMFWTLAYIWSIGASEYTVFGVFLLLRASTWFLVVFGLYILPAQVFPIEVRATCSGICAACGKLGAMVGIFWLPNNGWGEVGTFYFCGAVCFMAASVAAICLFGTTGHCPVQKLNFRPFPAADAANTLNSIGDGNKGRESAPLIDSA